MTINVTEFASISIAAENFDAMLAFYSKGLDIPLKKEDAGEFEYYKGRIGNIDFSLIPNSIAKVKAKENRHQITFRVTSLKQVLSNLVGFGGKIETDAVDEGDRLAVHVRDPDGNSLEIFSYKKDIED